VPIIPDPKQIMLPGPLPSPKYSGFALYILAGGQCLLVAALNGEIAWGGVYTPFEIEHLAPQFLAGAALGRSIAGGDPLPFTGWIDMRPPAPPPATAAVATEPPSTPDDPRRN
jgi:hypothetical protein